MKKIRFALVGCGRIAHRHAEQIRRVGELVAVCDSIPEKALLLAQTSGAAIFTSIGSLLSSGLPMDIIVICTPNGWHAPHAIQAMQAGYHVLVEKPLALTAQDAAEILNVSRQTGRRLYTVVQNRFNPPVVEVKRALDKGAFGQISSVQVNCYWHRDEDYYRNSWHGTADMDGGILYTQFSHFIDLLGWFFGEVQDVQAFVRNAQHPYTGIDDCGTAILRFTSGVIAGISFSVNSYARNREGSLTIMGGKGMVKIGGEYLNTLDYASFAAYEMPDPPSLKTANDYGSYRGSMSNHDQVYDSLAANLWRQLPFYADAADAVKTVDIIERIYKAAKDTKA